jgi:hypothetical protein
MKNSPISVTGSTRNIPIDISELYPFDVHERDFSCAFYAFVFSSTVDIRKKKII